MAADAEPIRPDPPLASLEQPEAPPLRVPWRNLLWLALFAAVLLAVVYLTPLRSYLSQVRFGVISELVKSLGLWAPLVLTLGVAALVAVGFPRLLFCVIAGMALGFWSGLFYAQVGTLLGNYAIFLIARRGGRDWARHYLAKRGRLHSLVQREGISGVILARQLPVPGLLINLACGLFSVRQRDFLLGTVLGQLPEAVPCTLIGAGALQPSFTKSFGTISLGVIAAVLAWMALRWALRREAGGASGR